ncbi:MAG: methionyl-tRNA formyltransferase [Saprospiraceae bacterium]
MRKLKIVFMGTPEFAVPSLKILLDHDYDIAAVVTTTDKPGGRGRTAMTLSPVKRIAVEKGLTVLQPEKLRDPEFQDTLRALDANLFVVVAFRMLPKSVWQMPAYGTFNLHGSLLPQYRGAAPINWAIIRGETQTGVTSFFLDETIDTGRIIFQERMDILPDETAGELHDRMMHLGASVVLKTVRAIENGTPETLPQEDRAATHAPKIFHDTCRIDFAKTAAEVHNLIRGLSPYPGAFAQLQGHTLKITRSSVEITPHSYPPGAYFTDKRNFLKVSTPDGFVHLTELQMEGRRRMGVKDFLNGFSF